MCTREMGHRRTGGGAVGVGDQKRVCFGNVDCPRPLFPGDMSLPPLARAGNKEDFYLDDDAAMDLKNNRKS